MREHHFFHGLQCHSFDVVTVDFPWPWETYSNAGRKKSPQYKTLSLDAIAKTRPEELLVNGGVMIAWCTWPLIGEQHLILQNAFGLEVKTGGAWSKRTASGKLRWGTGHIIRSVCEPFLIAAKRGHKLRGKNVSNLIETFDHAELAGVARENSRKPDEFYDLVERITPGWRRVDLFARQSREGWSTWGDEATKFDKKKKR